MKWFLMLVLCVAASALKLLRPYHEAEGILAMQRIQEYEQALNNSRIAMGIPVTKGTHPYLGGLMIHLVNGRMSICGASLLSNTKAVTAAHCWWDGRHQARYFTVVYGSDRLTTGGVRLLTNEVEIHASFNPLNYLNDIAIITHARVEYNEYINSIPLHTGTGSLENIWAIAVGYGRTTNDPFVEHLMDKNQVTLQVISNAACRNVWATVMIGPGTLCTNSAAGMSVCIGDSGGPLVIGSGSTRTLIGISSFGADAACGSGFPAGFKTISFFATWINNRISN